MNLKRSEIRSPGRMYAYAALLMSVGCSSGAPTVYGQAAPSFRPLPPAWDAPSTTSAPTTTGQPGYIGTPERAPRGTDKRVLPPTKEPGIWAADKPRTPEALPEPKLLEVPLPYPPDATTDVDKNPARLCAKSMNDAIARLASLGSRPPAPAAKSRPCAAALMYQKCIIEGAKAAKSAKDSGTAFDEAVFDAFLRTLQQANTWQKAMCPDDRDNTDAAGFAHAVISEWMRHEHGQNAKH